MPQQPQEPLSKLQARINYVIRQPAPRGGFPPELPNPQTRQTDVLTTYQNLDQWYFQDTFNLLSWQDWPLHIKIITIPCTVTGWLTVDYYSATTYLDLEFSPDEAGNVPGGSLFHEIPGADHGKPWDTDWQTMPPCGLPHTIYWRFLRATSPLAPLLPMFVSSPTVHGVIGDHCVFRGPLYPKGAIYGETPPNGYGTRMRSRARNVVYTDPNHAARRVNFQSAGQQWQDLTPAEQADWNAAARTLKPPTTGYALWTQIIATRRLDRLPTLNARIGKTLVAPDFPT